MDLPKHARGMAKKEKETGEGKEKEGFLETGAWAETDSKLEWTEPDRAGERNWQTADRGGQTDGKEDIMTKIRGKPSWLGGADKRCWRRATEGKEETGWSEEMGKSGQDRQTESGGESIKTDRQMAGMRGAPGCLHSAVFTS